MPSARELLEQADALMRRNRSPLMDDIPVLTDSVPAVVRRRDAPAVPAAQEPGGPDTIPMLTESVDTVSAEPAAATPKPAAVVDEGDASTWLRTGGEEPSVIGDAPDSIARVPAYVDESPEEIEVVAPMEVEEAFDEELARRDAPDEPADAASAAAAEDAARVAAEQAAAEEAARIAAAELAIAEEAARVAAAEQAIAEEAARVEAEQAAAEEAARIAAEAAAAQEVAQRAAEEAAAAEAARKLAEENERKAADEVARKAAEDARWASMGEEIRMQVLQRIDLFTDTGLRDQLGARLQPIVDRASADLVATINQHVGDLLRSYVAEAIEREIENWKRNSRNP